MTLPGSEKATPLNPCPFCGGQARGENQGPMTGYVVCYPGCGAKKVADSQSTARKQWNTRPIEDALKEENRRLRAALERIADEDEWFCSDQCVTSMQEIAKEALNNGKEG